MLDRAAGGFRVGPYGLYVPAGRRYVPGTNLIETTWMTPQGWLRVIDGLTIGEWHDNKHGSSHTRPPTDYDADHLLVRMLECTQGQVQVEIVCEPMIDYGATAAEWTIVDAVSEGGYALDASAGETTVRLLSDMRMGIEGNSARARHTLARASDASARSPGPKSCGGRAPSTRRTSASKGPATSGARGWRKAAIPTIPGAPTCSARRSR